MNSAARNAVSVTGSSQKENMPVCTLVQSWEIFFPDVIIFEQKSGNDTSGGFELAVGGGHRISTC
jgi:hypothetical protein